MAVPFRWPRLPPPRPKAGRAWFPPAPPATPSQAPPYRQLRARHAGSAKGTFTPLAEDHLSSRSLQHRGDRDVDRLANHLPRVVDDDHRAIIQISDALVVFLAFFKDKHFHDLARQHDGLERVRQLVDVQDRD